MRWILRSWTYCKPSLYRWRRPTTPPVTTPDPIESAEANITASVENNIISTSTVYSGVSELGNEWITDGFLTFSENIPASSEVQIILPAIGGDPVTIGAVSANTPIWLSDIIKDQNSAIVTRTKLNAHTTQAFNFEIITDTQFSGNLSFTVIASDGSNLLNTRQSTNPITEFETLGTTSVTGVTFTV